jgi:hypothetical protein
MIIFYFPTNNHINRYAALFFMSQVPDGGYKFHVGSYCKLNSEYPDNVTSVSDVITIVKDIGNQIPDNSWMLYLLEFYIDKFKEFPIPVELDLTCSFNDNGKFVAIFGGQDQYTFKKIVPIIGHSYRRQILMDPHKRLVNYNLTDLQTGQSEIFELSEEKIRNVKNILQDYRMSDIKEIEFVGADHFTGLEWHNRSYDGPYPIRYQVDISMLQYDKSDSADPVRLSYLPYKALISGKDEGDKGYPVAFQDIKLMNNCICYTIGSGNCQDGMNCNY